MKRVLSEYYAKHIALDIQKAKIANELCKYLDSLEFCTEKSVQEFYLHIWRSKLTVKLTKHPMDYKWALLVADGDAWLYKGDVKLSEYTGLAVVQNLEVNLKTLNSLYTLTLT